MRVMQHCDVEMAYSSGVLQYWNVGNAMLQGRNGPFIGVFQTCCTGNAILQCRNGHPKIYDF